MSDNEQQDWPNVTRWIVNGEPFTDLADAEEYADRLERAGVDVQLTRREEPL
jgi:acetyl esterase/lipase